MICLRCGHCCIHYDVIILADPALPLSESNIRHKPGGERCPHLRGNTAGEYSCAVHDHPQYSETPCFEFTQVEQEDSPCRIGTYVMYQLKGD